MVGLPSSLLIGEQGRGIPEGGMVAATTSFHREKRMFSIRQKHKISEAVQKILRETNHPELPEGEISFYLHINGAEGWSWADIENNGAIATPSINPHNERQDPNSSEEKNDAPATQ